MNNTLEITIVPWIRLNLDIVKEICESEDTVILISKLKD